MARLLRWMPEGWAEKELFAAVSFTTVAESFDSNPPPGKFTITAPSFTDSSVEENQLATELSLELVVVEGRVQVHLGLYDPWEVLAHQEALQDQRRQRGRHTVRWALDEESVKPDWASFPSITSRVSRGVAHKSVRFTEPEVDPVSEKLATQKKRAVKGAAQGLWGSLKRRLVRGATFDCTSTPRTASFAVSHKHSKKVCQ